MHELHFYFYTDILLGFALPYIEFNNSVINSEVGLFVRIIEKPVR